MRMLRQREIVIARERERVREITRKRERMRESARKRARERERMRGRERVKERERVVVSSACASSGKQYMNTYETQKVHIIGLLHRLLQQHTRPAMSKRVARKKKGSSKKKTWREKKAF